MKRMIALFLSALLLAGPLIGCEKQEAIEKLPFEELMRTRTAEPPSEKAFDSTSVRQLLEKHQASGTAVSVVTGEVADVRCFMTWDERGYGGYSIAEVKVLSVVGTHNDAQMQEEQTVFLYQSWHPRFVEEKDKYAFIREQTGLKVNSYQEMCEANYPASVFEITPLAGVAYEKFVERDELPLWPGKQYAMMLYPSNRQAEGYEALWGSSLHWDLSDADRAAVKESAAELAETYGLRFSYELPILCGDLVEMAHGKTLDEIR